MGMEIERKFLRNDDSWRKNVTQSTVFKQRYLPLSGGAAYVSGRVRIAGKKAFLTLKSAAKGFSRNEFEYEIPVADAEQMLNLFCVGGAIDKVRHIVVYQGFRWEIDEFRGENTGLFIAEIELESETQSFPRPEWLGKEVTGDHRYANSQLARTPYSQWKK